MHLLLQHDLAVIARGRGVTPAAMRQSLTAAVAAVQASQAAEQRAAAVVVPMPRNAAEDAPVEVPLAG